MILTNCAACAAPLAHDAPRCIRCKTRYCDATCQHGQRRCVAALLAAGASPDLEGGPWQPRRLPTELIGAKHRIILPMLLRAGAPLPRYDRAARCPTLYAGLLELTYAQVRIGCNGPRMPWRAGILSKSGRPGPGRLTKNRTARPSSPCSFRSSPACSRLSPHASSWSSSSTRVFTRS